MPQPENEAQVRELIGVPAKKLPEVWRKVVANAGDLPITAKTVRAVAVEYKPVPQALKVKPPVKKPGVESAILKPALRLIDEAERRSKKAARKRSCLP
jgi:hypothetical protein